ncbi:hypothetical protein [Methanocorpusculum sp. GPch4]|uniref:hypothetical protein n=1 Tax=Methanocorpusculum sp. GPch4 TaxID=2527877 RepID=UPI001432ED0F|nr:hypothetical protein [Methanocorpusculum sp. GPch4]
METIPGTRNRRRLVLACLVAAMVMVLARVLLSPSSPPAPVEPPGPTESPVPVEPPGRTESPARPEPETSSPDDLNMWAIPVPEAMAPPSPSPGAWKTMRHEGYMYSFQIPGDWVICTPTQMNRSRSRLVAPPAQNEVRVICAPFGIYDRPLDVDVPAMDDAFLLHDPRIHAVTEVSSSQPKAGRFDTRRKVRRVIFKNQALPWMAIATYVIARPKCFALVLLCPEGRLKETLPVYEQMVRSFDHWSPELH